MNKQYKDVSSFLDDVHNELSIKNRLSTWFRA